MRGLESSDMGRSLRYYYCILCVLSIDFMSWKLLLVATLQFFVLFFAYQVNHGNYLTKKTSNSLGAVRGLMHRTKRLLLHKRRHRTHLEEIHRNVLQGSKERSLLEDAK